MSTTTKNKPKTKKAKQSAGSKKVKNRRKPAESKLNLKQRAFINYYTNIDNPKTFGNGTQSYLAAYGNNSYKSATVSSIGLLSNPTVKSELDRLIDQLDMGSQVRLGIIKDVMTGNTAQKITTKGITADGNEYVTEVERQPTASERLKAIDLLAKIDGTYDKNRVKADVMSSDLKAIIRRHRKELDG